MNVNIYMVMIGYLIFFFVSCKLVFRGFISVLYCLIDIRVSVSLVIRSDILVMCCMVINLYRIFLSMLLGCVIKFFSKIFGIYYSNVNKLVRVRLVRRKFVVVCM